MASLAGDRDLLESRLTTLTRENRRLKEEIEAMQQSRGAIDEGEGTAILRERMNHLAAQVVNLTAMIEGPGSSIAKALAAPEATVRPTNPAGDKVTSLADRVRALQKAAAGG
jgi:cell division septum initiation protein DivIVA